MPDSPRRPGPIRFGVFEVDLRSGELRKAGVRLTLQEQPLQVLVMLLERPGQVVTRDELRSRLWPSDTFVDFDHGLNAAVNRLRDTLGDSASSPRFVETLPRRGYRFIAPVDVASEAFAHTFSTIGGDATLSRTTGPGIAPETRSGAVVPAQRGRRIFAASAAGVMLLFAIAGWLISQGRPVTRVPERVMALTTLPGIERQPTFSPDGTQVAFTWTQGKELYGHSQIYITAVGSTAVRALAMDSAADQSAPSWSPDGRQIAFKSVRSGSQEPAKIYLISPVGGTPVKLADFPTNWGVGRIGWSPDSRFVVAGRASVGGSPGLYLLPLGGGSIRQITRATAPAFHDAPAFSPDGRTLAYVSCLESYMTGCDIYAVTVDLQRAVASVPQRITRQLAAIWSLAWTRDGTSIVFNQTEGQLSYLWRVDADGSQQPERIEIAGEGAAEPTTTISADRLAFDRVRKDLDIYAASADGTRPLLTSSYDDFQPQFSPDGRQIAFISRRSGQAEIWLAAADGTAVHQLTVGPGRYQSEPHWSPDGASIAFESAGEDGHWHIWTIDADGGAPRQLTQSDGEQMVPSWSHDGRWIYFTSQGGANRETAIWRVPPIGGQAQRVTEAGDYTLGCEAADGKNVLYRSVSGPGPLLSVPLGGGPARQVVSCVRGGRSFTSRTEGIYYVPCESPIDPPVRLLDAQSGRDRAVAFPQNAEHVDGDFSVSPDGRTILYTRRMELTADLMLIENFK